jgi:hypothetical protein
VSNDHEYLLVYGKRSAGRFRGKTKDFTKYSNPDDDPRGAWTSCSLLGKATRQQRPNLHYDFEDPTTGTVYPCPPRTGWICSPETMRSYAEDKRLLYPRKVGGRIRVKVFRHELRSEVMGFPSVITEYATSQGTLELREILGEQAFSFPKPSDLIAELIEQATGPGDLVLDSFAGSGTTGHATLKVNETLGTHRRFILIEMDERICKDVTCVRLKRVIEGYDAGEGDKRKRVPGLGGGFRYCRLGEPLFDATGRIRDVVRFSDLAAHVFFSETGVPLPRRSSARSPLLGLHGGTAIYLLFNGVLGDRRPAGATL